MRMVREIFEKLIAYARMVGLKVLVISAIGVSFFCLFWLPTDLPSSADLSWTDRWFALGADPARFLLQGKWLAEGRGFRETNPDGMFCTSLPPGYPVFLAALSFFSADLQSWRIAQCVILISCSIVMYLACRSVAPRSAFWLSIGVVGSPWLAPLVSLFMSEGLGAALACLFAALLVRCTSLDNVSRSGGLIQHFTLGLLASALSLTSPGMAPVLGLTVLQTCITAWNVPNRMRWCLIGAGLPMILWQTHCIYASGRPAWLLLQALGPQPGRKWVDSWARSERETVLGYGSFLWATSLPDLSLIPQHAYRDASERDLVEALVVGCFAEDHENQDLRSEKRRRLANLLDSIADEKRRSHPAEVYIYLPIVRGISSWIDLRPVDFRNLEDPQLIHRLGPGNLVRDFQKFGFQRALARLVRPCLALYCICYHIALMACIGLTVFVVMRSRDWFTIGLLLSVGVFVFLHGYGGPEARRNLPVVPILCCLPIVCATRAARRNVSWPARTLGDMS